MRHSPLWDPRSCNAPVSITACTHTPFLLAPRKQSNPSRTQKALYQAKIILGKGRQRCALWKPGRCHQAFSFYRTVTWKGLKPQRGVPTYGPAQAVQQPLLGSPVLLLSPSGICHFWVPRKGSDEISRSWKDFLKQASNGEGKAHSLPCLVCLCVLKSWPAAGAGTEHAPSSDFAICGWGQEQRGKRLQAGCMLDPLLLGNLVLIKGLRL